MPAIAIRHLSKTFEQKGNSVEALRDISLDIEEGDIYGIIGMSGAGKSTLVRCLNYLERPTSGEVIIGGRDLGTLTEKELREQRSDIAMIFQHFNLLMQKSVLDNVCFPMQIAKKKKDEAKKRALELLETVGLADKADAYPAQLSGGQKQRVAIARALATDPKILLCDEATSALDPQTTQSILALLKEINRKFGITIVIITHQMSVIREICSHVAIVEKGSIVEVGLVEEIFNHPKSRVARSLILSDRAADAASYSGAEGDTADGAELTGWSGESRQRDRIGDDKKLRIVFSENSAFEPVIANMVLKFGTPVNILEGIERGVDMFDCVMPTRNGRNGQLFTAEGVINIRNKKWEDDFSPVDPTGTAFVDRLYSKAYLHHLCVCGEMLAAEIASLHNIAFYLRLVGAAREHILAGDFRAWKERMVEKLTRRL